MDIFSQRNFFKGYRATWQTCPQEGICSGTEAYERRRHKSQANN
jgi:hypothetical protein